VNQASETTAKDQGQDQGQAQDQDQDQDQDKLVTIATFPDLPEAELAKERLENESIPAFVLHGGSAGVLPGVTTAAGIQVQVNASDIAKAREVLES
jgi:hypothetical protein